jgi:diacylglycerol kinase family enzyme
MNAVLEGCHVGGAIPPDLRLAFLRKGSADLIGKALHVPDDLGQATLAISRAITADRTMPADVLAVETIGADGRGEVRHVLGFGGIGLFGDLPRFTEVPVVKLYKGLLGTLFGDLGPFYAGLALATVTWCARCAVGRVPVFELDLDGERLRPERWQTVVILNGELGREFRIARGLRFRSGSFRVVVLHHRSARAMLRQLRGALTGALLDDPAAYDVTVREVRTFVARPIGTPRRFMVNVDGLRQHSVGPVRVSVSGEVQLVDARDDDVVEPVPEVARRAG